MNSTVHFPGLRARAMPASVPRTSAISVLITATSRDVLTASTIVVLSHRSPHQWVENLVHRKIVLKSLNDIAIRKKIGVKRKRITNAVHSGSAILPNLAPTFFHTEGFGACGTTRVG